MSLLQNPHSSDERAQRRQPKPSDIDWIGSHSPGTKKGDIYESQAISSVFGEKTPPVTALKSYFGHTIGASGVNELIAMIEASRRGMIIPTLNLKDIDEKSKINHCQEIKHCRVRYILKLIWLLWNQLKHCFKNKERETAITIIAKKTLKINFWAILKLIWTKTSFYWIEKSSHQKLKLPRNFEAYG